MPNSYADYIADWEKLLANIGTNAAELPDLGAHVKPLALLLEEVKMMGAHQLSRKAVRQQVTKDMKSKLVEGRNLAARVRAALKAHFGLQSELLVEYGARPIRPRTRTTKVEPPEPVEGPAPTVSG